MSETSEMSVESTDLTAGSRTSKSGVRGWLLVLCVFLTLVVPVLNLGVVGLDLVNTLPVAADIPGLGALLVMNGTMVLALVVFSIYVGVSLWRRRDPGAVKLARVFFALLLASKLIAIALPFMVGMSSDVASSVARSVASGMGGAVVLSVGWMTYLERSRRVRETYGLAATQSA